MARSPQIWQQCRSLSVAIQYWRYTRTWLTFRTLAWCRSANCCVAYRERIFPCHRSSSPNRRIGNLELWPIGSHSPIPLRVEELVRLQKSNSGQVEILNDSTPTNAPKPSESQLCPRGKQKGEALPHAVAERINLACISVSLALLDVDEYSIHQEGQKYLRTFVHHIPWREAPRPGWLGCCTHCWVSLDVGSTIQTFCYIETRICVWCLTCKA